MGERSLCLHLLFIWMTFEMLSIYGTAWTEQKNMAQALPGSLDPTTGFLIFQFCLFLTTCFANRTCLFIFTSLFSANKVDFKTMRT